MTLSSCSTGGMIYDDIFNKGEDPISLSSSARRPINTAGQDMSMMGQPQMPQMGYPNNMGGMGGGNPLADIGNMGVGGPMSQNQFAVPQQQNLPPVQYNIPSAPIYDQQQLPQMQSGFGTPPMTAWNGMPTPSYAPQPQVMQPQYPSYAPQQQNYAYSPPPQPQPPQQIQMPQIQPPAIQALQAPSYTTPINMAPAPVNYQPQPQPVIMMAQPPQPFEPPISPQQPQTQPQTEEKENLLKPLSSIDEVEPSDDLKSLEEDISSEINKTEPPPLPDEGELAAIPIEKVDIDSLTTEDYTAPAPEADVTTLLQDPKRNLHTPASGIINTMQTIGVPASISSINQNIDTLNTPLGFDNYGNPIVPPSFKQQVYAAPINQGLYPSSPVTLQAPPASLTNPSTTINSLKQRANNMGM